MEHEHVLSPFLYPYCLILQLKTELLVVLPLYVAIDSQYYIYTLVPTRLYML